MGRKNLKALAESQFNFNAKPISIKSFLKDLETEEAIPIVPPEDNNQCQVVSSIIEDEPTDPPAINEVAINIGLLKYFEPADDNVDLDISHLFTIEETSDPIIQRSLAINEELQNIDSENDFEFSISKDLNHTRRFNQVVSDIKILAPNFSSEVMKFTVDSAQYQPETVHINDSQGLTELNDLLTRNISFLSPSQRKVLLYNHLMISSIKKRELTSLPLKSRVKEFLQLIEIEEEFDLTIEELFQKIRIKLVNSIPSRSSRSRDIRLLATVLYSELPPDEKIKKIRTLGHLSIIKYQAEFLDDFDHYLKVHGHDEFWFLKE